MSRESMRIGYYVPQYPRMSSDNGYVCGGVGYAAAGLAEAMGSLGHHVTVLTSSPSRTQSSRIQNGVEVIEFPNSVNLSQAKVSASLLWGGIRRDFDVVHGHLGNPPAAFGALVHHLLKGTPLVVTYHGDPYPAYGSPWRQLAVRTYQGWPLRFLCQRADVLYVPSIEFLGDSKILSAVDRPIEELPNGVPLRKPPTDSFRRKKRDDLGLSPADHVVVFVGSMNPYKHPDLLLEAAAEIRQGIRDLKVLFVGDGPLLDSLMERAKTLGLGGVVRFEGFVDHAVVADYLVAADVLALPSRSEMFPLVVLEAFSVGLPVVVSDLRTFRRFVTHSKNGVIVSVDSPAEFGDAILRLLTEKRRRVEMGDEALKTARSFGWDRIAGHAEERYRGLLGS